MAETRKLLSASYQQEPGAGRAQAAAAALAARVLNPSFVFPSLLAGQQPLSFLKYQNAHEK